MSRRYALSAPPSPPLIVPSCRLALGATWRLSGTPAPTSGASPWSDAADFVLAFPFVLESPTVVYKGFWFNGSSAGGNTDVAIYDEDYNLITSVGSTLGSGNSLPQAVAFPSSIKLPPGRYYAGISHSATTTNRFQRYSVATFGIAMLMARGCWKFADNPPISSATATPADLTNVAFPAFGLITRTGFDL